KGVLQPRRTTYDDVGSRVGWLTRTQPARGDDRSVSPTTEGARSHVSISGPGWSRADAPRSGPPCEPGGTPSQPSRMARLAGFAQRHHWAALLAWAVLLVGVSVAAQAIGDDYANGSDAGLPGTQSQELPDLLDQHAPGLTGDRSTVVLHDERGWNAEVDLEALTGELSALDHVDSVTGPDARDGSVSP